MNELPPFELFAEIYRRHGHRCPMSTLGGRLGFAARRRLGLEVPPADLAAIYQTATCALDGIREATGCSEADATLAVCEKGRHRLALFDRRSGLGLAVELRPATLLLAAEYRRLEEALEKDRPLLGGEELAERLRQKEVFLDLLLERLRTLPDEELLEFEPFCGETPEA